jgi:hypothetical protein
LTVINGDKSYSFLDWMNRSKRHISH